MVLSCTGKFVESTPSLDRGWKIRNKYQRNVSRDGSPQIKYVQGFRFKGQKKAAAVEIEFKMLKIDKMQNERLSMKTPNIMSERNSSRDNSRRPYVMEALGKVKCTAAAAMLGYIYSAHENLCIEPIPGIRIVCKSIPSMACQGRLDHGSTYAG